MDRTLLDSETYWINSHMIWEYNQTVYHRLILAGLMLAHNQLLLVHVNARPCVLELRHQFSRWHLRWEGRRCSFIESRCLFPSCFHFFGEEDPFSDNKHRYSYPESDTLHGNAYEFFFSTSGTLCMWPLCSHIHKTLLRWITMSILSVLKMGQQGGFHELQTCSYLILFINSKFTHKFNPPICCFFS